MLDRLNRLAAFQNPEFYKAQAMRLPTSTSRGSSVAPRFPSFWPYPEAFWMNRCCSPTQNRRRVEDERLAGKPINVTFIGTLRERAAGRSDEASETR